MYRYVVLWFFVSILCLAVSGCGETLQGVGKDVNRMSKGAGTFFFRQK